MEDQPLAPSPQSFATNNEEQPVKDPSDTLLSDITNDIESKDSAQKNCHQSTGCLEDKDGEQHCRESEVQASTSSPTKSPASYHIKWITWKNKKTPIITQNENGPCPLIAISNVLILNNHIKLPSIIEVITASQLMEYVGDCILENVPKDIPESAQLNYEQNMQDAIAILPKLQTGLDVNVRFTGVQDFEYTPECVVFDLLHIPLYHGWLVDPQTPEVVAAVAPYSYNQLVEKVIYNKASSQVELVTEALLAENFLQKTASQLTYHGLCELTSTMKDEELAVLFRNNHFITLLKHRNELFQLVTDQGFLTESEVVWETLNNIEGDGEFVDGNFVSVKPSLTREQQIDQDYLVALTLQEEQKQQQKKDREWEEYKHKVGLSNASNDEELAKRLQQQYEGASARRSHHPSTSSQSDSSKSKTRDCAIL